MSNIQDSGPQTYCQQDMPKNSLYQLLKVAIMHTPQSSSTATVHAFFPASQGTTQLTGKSTAWGGRSWMGALVSNVAYMPMAQDILCYINRTPLTQIDASLLNPDPCVSIQNYYLAYKALPKT